MIFGKVLSFVFSIKKVDRLFAQIMAPRVRSSKMKKKIHGGSRLGSRSGASSIAVEPPTMDSREPGSLPRDVGVNILGSELEPSPSKEDSASSEQGRAASLGLESLEGYKQFVGYLRAAAKVIEEICGKKIYSESSPQRWWMDSSTHKGAPREGAHKETKGAGPRAREGFFGRQDDTRCYCS